MADKRVLEDAALPATAKRPRTRKQGDRPLEAPEATATLAVQSSCSDTEPEVLSEEEEKQLAKMAILLPAESLTTCSQSQSAKAAEAAESLNSQSGQAASEESLISCSQSARLAAMDEKIRGLESQLHFVKQVCKELSKSIGNMAVINMQMLTACLPG